MKKCNFCSTEKDEIMFSKKWNWLSGRCKSCTSKYFAEWAKVNKDKHNANVRAYKKKHKTKIQSKFYWISEEELINLHKISEWKCMICWIQWNLNIDHCHTTNKVRWLLCNWCNFWIWLFKDNTDLLKSAINYLS
jgi:hypothetical protein